MRILAIFICMNPPQERENTITHYRIVEDNQVGGVREDIGNYDLLDTTMICLGKSRKRVYNHVLRLLDVLLSMEMPAREKKEILQNEFTIKMVEQMEGDVNEMCNLSEGVEQRGIEKGLARGRQEGRAEVIRKLLNSGMTAEKIASILEVPQTEVEQLQ